MDKNIDRNKIFTEACKNAGLEVQTEESPHIKQGLILRDAKGQEYTVDANGNLQKKQPQKNVSVIVINEAGEKNAKRIIQIAASKRAGGTRYKKA